VPDPAVEYGHVEICWTLSYPVEHMLRVLHGVRYLDSPVYSGAGGCWSIVVEDAGRYEVALHYRDGHFWRPAQTEYLCVNTESGDNPNAACQ
jgi:hypothetical protein